VVGKGSIFEASKFLAAFKKTFKATFRTVMIVRCHMSLGDLSPVISSKAEI
jgi:hypothetical protein